MIQGEDILIHTCAKSIAPNKKQIKKKNQKPEQKLAQKYLPVNSTAGTSQKVKLRDEFHGEAQ